MVGSNKTGEEHGPDEAKDFAELLTGHEIKDTRAEGIARFIARTGSPTVFDDPQELAAKLERYTKEIAPYKRRRILEEWFAGRKIPIPEGLLETAELSGEEKTKKEKEEEKKKKIKEGAVWTADVDESGTPRIRIIKDETEFGVTLAEAKLAAKEIGKAREEPIVIFNEELGRHMPNFKSSFVKQNLGAAWATARQMDKAVAEGEPIDPIDAWIEQQAKLAQFKEVMGLTSETKERGTVGEIVSALKDLKAMAEEGKVTGVPEWMTDPVKFIETVKTITTPETRDKGTVTEIVSALKDLKAMAEEGKVSGVPEWMTDPLKFIETVRGVTGAGEGKGLPEWMTDPFKFIEIVEKISGGGKPDEALKQQIAGLEKTIADMQEQRYKEQIEGQQRQIEALTGRVGELADLVVDLKRPVTGRTEMDLLHEVATEGLGVIKSELPGFRRDIKEAIVGGALPPPKTAEERQVRTEKLRQAVQTDKEIEELGRRLFFKEG